MNSFSVTVSSLSLSIIGGWNNPAVGGIEDWGKQLGRGDLDNYQGALDPLLHGEKLIVEPREDATSKYVLVSDIRICRSRHQYFFMINIFLLHS